MSEQPDETTIETGDEEGTETPAAPTQEPDEPEPATTATPAEPAEPAEPDDPAEPAEPAPGTDEPDEDEELRRQAQVDIEQMMKQLDREDKRHAAKVEQVMGTEFQFARPCPLCEESTAGYLFPTPLTADTVRAVKEAIGEPEQPPYKADRFSKVCEDCDGLGAVATGSKVSGQAQATCITCTGRGWIALGPERQSGQVVAFPGAPPPVSYGQDEPPAVEPPEVAALKKLGYVVVAPIQTDPAIAAG